MVVTITGTPHHRQNSSDAPASQEKLQLSYNDLTALLENKQLDTTGDFKQFLSSVIASKAISLSRSDALKAYVDNRTISESAAALLPSLLGLWVCRHYYNDAEALLASMVAIPSSNTPDVPPNQNPNIIAMGKLIEKMAWKWRLVYKNIGNYVFEVSLPGDTDEDVGIVTHADVVPADPKKWLLDDGQQLNPYKLTKIGDRLYGRGSEDDKSAIVSAIYAMKAIKENKLPLHRGIRLMIRTTGETSGEGIEYYKRHRILPPYNIVLDSLHPVIIPKNNTGSIKAIFPVSPLPNAKKPAIVQFTGSHSQNQVNSESTAIISGIDTTQVVKKLTIAKQRFLSDRGNDIAITISPEHNQLKVVVVAATSTQSSRHEGINPVTAMAGFLATSRTAFVDNEYNKAVHYINDLYGKNDKANQLSVTSSDDFMKPLTLSSIYLEATRKGLVVATNVLAPQRRNVSNTRQAIEKKLNQYARDTNNQMKIQVSIEGWMDHKPESIWVQTLLNIYSQVTGQTGNSVEAAGSTTAREIPNAVNFKTSTPGQHSIGHAPNEFKTTESMQMDMQMLTEIMLRISNLPHMK